MLSQHLEQPHLFLDLKACHFPQVFQTFRVTKDIPHADVLDVRESESLKQSMEKMVMLLEFLTFDILDAADRVSLVREGGRVDGGLVII